jgi:serine/threonine protein kinase
LNYRLSNNPEDSLQLEGHYRLGELLGQGGVARVFSAIDILTGEHLALKLSHEGDPEAAAAIRYEFQFAMTHRHPAFVNPLTLLHENKRPLIVMPYVDGISQSDLRKLLISADNRSEYSWTEYFIAQILEGAAFIHFSGYLYNDYKPANFIWQQDQKTGEVSPRLLDFNLVSKIGQELPKRGTIEYVAPEVLLGQMPNSASDLYSIGATLFELWTGAPPYTSEDSSALIKLITEEGRIDLSAIPQPYQAGMAALLERDPSRRPQNAAQAAEAFGLTGNFDALINSHKNYYLWAGRPPFADQLLKTAYEYIPGKSGKVLLIIGSGQGTSELDYLSADLSLAGYSIERIRKDAPKEIVASILDYLLSECQDGALARTVLAIDEIGSVSAEEQSKYRALLREPRCLPVITCGQRWTQYNLPHQIFDPLALHSAVGATREVVSSYLKRDFADLEPLSHACGGDPELIFKHLNYAIELGQLSLLSNDGRLKFPINLIPEMSDIAKRILQRLDTQSREMLSILSAWGADIPMILLGEFSVAQEECLDALLASGYLRRGKDSVSFPSGDVRQYIYNETPVAERESYHRFWAETTERVLAESDDLKETLAIHWGLSDNSQKGFEANLAVTKDLLQKSELGKAGVFAETLLELARLGAGSVATALMIKADIKKQSGDYLEARRGYLELLRTLSQEENIMLRAETFKDLSDLYRSTKKTGRALYYVRKALNLFDRLGNEQGMADCHNNIGLISWVNQKYEMALDSLSQAFELNQRLGNLQEQAKIQSNIGIIKDIMGRTAEVAGHFEKAYFDSQKAGDFRLEALTANNLGYFFIRQNQLDKARDYLLKAVNISKKISYTDSLINALSNLGLVGLKSGALFEAIDYCQRAIQMADAIGSKHLACDAQLFLSEVGILMGNFSLSHAVLESLSNDKIYADNKAFAAQVDLLRSWWHRAVGDLKTAHYLAEQVINNAKTVGDQRLVVEAELACLLARSSDSDEITNNGLSKLIITARGLGHGDVADSAELALGRTYLVTGDIARASGLIDELLSCTGQSTRVTLEAQLLQGWLRLLESNYNQAINLLTEVETQAAASGYLPFALEASSQLADIYERCGKRSRGEDAQRRVRGYSQKIMGSIPAVKLRESYARLTVKSDIKC